MPRPEFDVTIDGAQARQTLFEKDLAKWRKGTYDEPIRLMQKEEDILIKIARMNEVQKRILKSYHFLILDLYEITEDFMLPVNGLKTRSPSLLHNSTAR